ncbi:MAG: aminotransferase class V-fold PLP-dependent enzyme [Ilumatobacteraceae bacterium]
MKHRFPGVADGWSRFGAPAGTQMVDQAIDAVAGWMRSPAMACSGGWFDASEATGELVGRARASVGRLFHADPAGVCFGPNMTSLTFAFSRAVAETLRPGDRVIGTRLDHEANVSPWRALSGQRRRPRARAVRCRVGHVAARTRRRSDRRADLLGDAPGASNLLGTAPDLAPIVDAAHAVGARVYVDAVALAPHRRIDVAALGCGAIVSSPYKWYGPHSGVLWVDPDLLDSLPVFRCARRPISDPAGSRPACRTTRRSPASTRPPGSCSTRAWTGSPRPRWRCSHPCCAASSRSTGSPCTALRAAGSHPTAAFRVEGVGPADVAKALAAERIAVWDGHNYALEVVDTLGLGDQGGVVRAGLARYLDLDDVQRLLGVVERLAAWS